MDKHYMRGGKPGDFPDFNNKYIPGGALNLYDPFGWNKNMPAESKEKRLLAEINNGRLAMIGIMGFCSESQLEGSVPALKGLIKHYDGEVRSGEGRLERSDIKSPHTHLTYTTFSTRRFAPHRSSPHPRLWHPSRLGRGSSISMVYSRLGSQGCMIGG